MKFGIMIEKCKYNSNHSNIVIYYPYICNHGSYKYVLVGMDQVHYTIYCVEKKKKKRIKYFLYD